MQNSSIKGIYKGLGPRLYCMCGSDNDHKKSKEYTKYLVNRGHDINSVQQCFNNVGKTS